MTSTNVVTRRLCLITAIAALGSAAAAPVGAQAATPAMKHHAMKHRHAMKHHKKHHHAMKRHMTR